MNSAKTANLLMAKYNYESQDFYVILLKPDTELFNLSFKMVVMCYGLLTDFKRELFPGSKRLIELADSIQEIKSICKCGKRAVANARFKDNKFVLSGEQVEIGAEDKYKALCKECYQKEVDNLLGNIPNR